MILLSFIERTFQILKLGSDFNNKLTNQDANEGADGQTVLLQESQDFLLLNYSHDAA